MTSRVGIMKHRNKDIGRDNQVIQGKAHNQSKRTTRSCMRRTTGPRKVASVCLALLAVLALRRMVKNDAAKLELSIKIGNDSYDQSPFCQNTRQGECVLYYPYADLADTPNAKLQNSEYTILTKRGSQKRGNQDRAIIVAPFVPTETQHDASNDFFLCVFDGHGERGHYAADFVSKQLPLVFSRHVQKLRANGFGDKESIQKIFSKTFNELDKHLTGFLLSGTTASCTYKRGTWMYVANVGDSTTMLVAFHRTKKTHEIIFQSRADTTKIPEEAERITNAGGILWKPPKSAGTATSSDPSRVFVQHRNGANIVNKALSLTRSIGDNIATAKGVISEPIVDTINLESHLQDSDLELFVLATSDGVTDQTETDSLLSTLSQSLFHENGASLQKTMESIFEKLSKSHKALRLSTNKYEDDLTLALAKISR